MPPNDRRFPILGFLLLSLVICGMLELSPGSVEAQATKPNRPEPRLPGAVEKAPDWLKDAPFDVAKFFEMPPASENAAPLYLEALFEFGTELEPIYPPEVRQRAAAIADRAKRLGLLNASWEKDPSQANRKAIDAILLEYKDGLDKLDLAQKRPRCLFAFGLTYDAPVTHAQVARNVTRILSMRVSRALERDGFDSAIGDLNRVFRISRDLRPRGAAICQLISIAFDSYACTKVIPLFLAHRKLKVEHCDRLLKILADHEAQAIEPFLEGMKTEYCMLRSTLREFTEGIKTTINSDGKPVETKLDRPGLVRELDLLFRQINPSVKNIPEQKLNEILDQFAREAVKDRDTANDYAKSLLDAKPGYPERVRVFDSLEATHRLKQPGLTLFKLILPDHRVFLLACGREQAYLGSTICLIALRRWQLTHNTPPTDLAEVCRAAKMPGVPVDPFSGSGSPLKLVMIAGEPVVYSIGPDGVDDGGLKDAEQGRNPTGDFLYRLPKRK